MDIIIALIVGLVIAALATIACGGAGLGLFGDICIGVAGAVGLGWAFHALHWVPFAGPVNDVVTTALGAIVLIAAFRLVRRTRTPARR